MTRIKRMPPKRSEPKQIRSNMKKKHKDVLTIEQRRILEETRSLTWYADANVIGLIEIIEKLERTVKHLKMHYRKAN